AAAVEKIPRTPDNQISLEIGLDGGARAGWQAVAPIDAKPAPAQGDPQAAQEDPPAAEATTPFGCVAHFEPGKERINYYFVASVGAVAIAGRIIHSQGDLAAGKLRIQLLQTDEQQHMIARIMR